MSTFSVSFSASKLSSPCYSSKHLFLVALPQPVHHPHRDRHLAWEHFLQICGLLLEPPVATAHVLLAPWVTGTPESKLTARSGNTPRARTKAEKPVHLFLANNGGRVGRRAGMDKSLHNTDHLLNQEANVFGVLEVIMQDIGMMARCLRTFSVNSFLVNASGSSSSPMPCLLLLPNGRKASSTACLYATCSGFFGGAPEHTRTLPRRTLGLWPWRPVSRPGRSRNHSRYVSIHHTQDSALTPCQTMNVAQLMRYHSIDGRARVSLSFDIGCKPVRAGQTNAELAVLRKLIQAGNHVQRRILKCRGRLCSCPVYGLKP